jgi:uncharacterized membrane protein YgaE (UPF0421/DUF939 family)
MPSISGRIALPEGLEIRMGSRSRAILNGSQLALRAAVASSISYVIAKWLALPSPVNALVSAIIVTDFSSFQTRALGFQRLFATLIGVSCGLAIWATFGPSEWVVGIGIFAAMAFSHLLNAGGGAKVSAFICALLLLNLGDSPWTFALHRLLETALGICVAWLVSIIPRLFNFEETPSGSAENPELPRDDRRSP